METTSEKKIVKNEKYSFENSVTNTTVQPEQSDKYYFDELNPAKLLISDIIY